MTDVRLRAVCDRCNRLKSRCSGKTEHGVCNRCLKAGVQCIFSPFRPKKVPEITKQASTPSTEQNSLTITNSEARTQGRLRSPDLPSTRETPDDLVFSQYLNVDIPSNLANLEDMDDCSSFQPPFDEMNWAGHNIFLQNYSNPVPDTTLETTDTLPSSFQQNKLLVQGSPFKLPQIGEVSGLLSSRPSFGDTLGIPKSQTHRFEDIEPAEADSKSNCIRLLSQLSVSLYEHSNTIPPLTIYDAPSSKPNGDMTTYSSKYKLEDTLKLTQSLIDVYPTFLDTFLQQPRAKTQTDWLSGQIVGTDLTEIDHIMDSASTLVPESALDHSSIHLILSCHLRLICIYETISTHMKCCVRKGGTSLATSRIVAELPQLKIGSYVPPPSATLPMQMLLFLQFGSQLLRYAAELTARIEEYGEDISQKETDYGSTKDDVVLLTRATAENVKTRALKLTHDLGTSRDEVLQALL